MRKIIGLSLLAIKCSNYLEKLTHDSEKYRPYIIELKNAQMNFNRVQLLLSCLVSDCVLSGRLFSYYLICPIHTRVALDVFLLSIQNTIITI